MVSEERLPRGLSEQERDLLLWILPADRPGYLPYRNLVEGWQIVARGRRGEGNYILAAPRVQADNESPLPQLLAYGVVETSVGDISVSIRERLGNQLEYEVVSMKGEGLPQVYQEMRRWTLSSWSPGQPCPSCGSSLREVVMMTEACLRLVLALCVRDRRLWVYDDATGINHPIPVTNFYNELMLHKKVREPAVALDWKRLFLDLPSFSDGDLTRAFETYNRLRTKIVLDRPIVVSEERKPFWVKRFLKFFSSTQIRTL
ncbi:MAG: hypothetical protein FJ217_06495 [Ignavibacteria bacterium]|nr:hypothetical protein [Ignavibacteria bacterium]